MPLSRSAVITHPGRAARRRAFTMIEMVLVLSIIGTMTALSMVAFTQVVRQLRVDRAAKTLSYDMQMAFSLVGRNRKPVQIVWDASKVQFVVTDRGNVTLFRTRPMGISSEFKLTPSNFTVSRSSVEIFPPGLAADTLNIRIVDGNTARTVSMSRGGLVRVINK